MTWQEKLHPRRYPNMSGKMAALVGIVMGERLTHPALISLVVTSDGDVLGEVEGDCGANQFIGSVEDWDDNWRRLLDAAELTDDERRAAEQARRAVTQDWRA